MTIHPDALVSLCVPGAVACLGVPNSTRIE